MKKKKEKQEQEENDFDEFEKELKDFDEDDSTEVASEEEEITLDDVKKVLNKFMGDQEVLNEKFTKAIKVDQKYLKKLYKEVKDLETRQDQLNENFELLYKDKK